MEFFIKSHALIIAFSNQINSKKREQMSFITYSNRVSVQLHENRFQLHREQLNRSTRESLRQQRE